MGDGELSGFVHYLRFEKRYSPHTLSAYECDVTQFNDYLQSNYPNITIANATHFHIRSWLATQKELSQTARSINRKMSSLSSLYVYLEKNGLATQNPVKKLHALRLPERLPTAMKEVETEKLLHDTPLPEGFEGQTIQLICELFYATGIRRSELQHLKENDIEWSRKTIRILGKGNKERLIPVSEQTLHNLKVYLTEKRKQEHYNDIYLFNLPSGLPLYAVYINRVVKTHMLNATTLHKKTPHVLRHSFATHLLNNGANIQAIKELLGHSSLAATQVYTHNDISRLKEIHKQNHPRG